ncbi:MAG TPA: DUF5072 domain-containing protein [Candidatus Mediterraneibacter pullistercoris]|nr:DUF5072 domain-containing protein [Candidatus Mediterraneibacter pullistercoris]
MAYQKLSPVTLIAAVQDKVEALTGLRCYDHVPLNEASPLYFAEITRIQPANSKTMYRDVYSVAIHCIAEESPSSVGVYNLIENLQSALSEDISLPEPFTLVMQTDNGVQTIKTDESGEKHAIVNFDFMVSYGFMCKI